MSAEWAGPDSTVPRAGGGAGPIEQRVLRKIDLGSAAVRRMYRAALGTPDGKMAGVLIGSKSTDGKIALVETIASPWHHSSVLDVQRGWKALLELTKAELDAGPDDLEVVGWYVVRAGSASALEREDLKLHSQLFPGWWQIALAIDPASREHGVYGWREGAVQRLGGGRGRSADGGSERASSQAARAASAQALRSTKRDSSRRAASERSPPDREGRPASRAKATAGTATGATPVVHPDHERWGTRMALIVPLGAGLIGGAVLAIVK